MWIIRRRLSPEPSTIPSKKARNLADDCVALRRKVLTYLMYAPLLSKFAGLEIMQVAPIVDTLSELLIYALFSFILLIGLADAL